METDIGSPEFWVGQWRASQARVACGSGRGYAGRDLWNRMASGYGREAAADSSRERETEGLVSTLSARGLLRPGFRVLDVGCGPGRKAIAFAEAGAEVVALDFSEMMLERLRASLAAGAGGGARTRSPGGSGPSRPTGRRSTLRSAAGRAPSTSSSPR